MAERQRMSNQTDGAAKFKPAVMNPESTCVPSEAFQTYIA